MGGKKQKYANLKVLQSKRTAKKINGMLYIS